MKAAKTTTHFGI